MQPCQEHGPELILCKGLAPWLCAAMPVDCKLITTNRGIMEDNSQNKKDNKHYFIDKYGKTQLLI